jgi:hypothetical protein
VAAPEQVDVWVGLDVSKLEHFADVLDDRDALASTAPALERAAGRNAALICLARRRCDVILAMLRTGRPYQPARPAAEPARGA